MSLPRWQRLLARPGARLRRMPDGGYGVFPDGDMRRRPLARLKSEIMVTARADGLITGDDDSGYVLAASASDLAQRRDGDFRTPHQSTVRRNIFEPSGRITSREIDLSGSPLARWAPGKGGSGWLSQAEFEAGERLRDDYHRSVLSERVTSDWAGYLAPARSGKARSKEDAPQSALDAKQRVLRALEAVGPGLDGMLSRICLRELGLEAAEAEGGWPSRSGKALLKLALQRLALHYGLVSRKQLELKP